VGSREKPLQNETILHQFLTILVETSGV